MVWHRMGSGGGTFYLLSLRIPSSGPEAPPADGADHTTGDSMIVFSLECDAVGLSGAARWTAVASFILLLAILSKRVPTPTLVLTSKQSRLR